MTAFSEEWLANYQARMAESKPTRRVSRKCDLSDDELLALYRETGSIWKTGERAGISGSRVQQRIRPLLGPGLEGQRLWTKQEDERLLQDYSLYAAGGILETLAGEMGRTRGTISREARRLGLTGKLKGHPWARGGKLKGIASEFAEVHDTMNDASLAEKFGVGISAICRWRTILGLKKDPKRRWIHTPHPKGATGLIISQSHKDAMAAGGRSAWADPNHKVNSLAARQRRSDHMSKMSASGKMRVGYSRGSMGRRADLGDMFFRSSWEANYARYLNFLIEKGQIHHWEYEADTFWFKAILRGVRSYKPDFKVWTRPDSMPYYVEIKGYMDAKSKTKLKRMKKYYPSIRVDVVDQKQFKAFAQTIGALLQNWERPSGSVFSGRRELLL